MPAAARVSGTVAPGWEPVRATFAENFTDRHEIGAAVCVWQGEECVVDLWGGVADQRDGRPWRADTLVLVMSTTKAWVGAAVLRLMTFYFDKWFGQSSGFLLGVVYVVLVLFVPYGIVGTWRLRGFKWRQGWQRLLEALSLK